MRLWRVFNIPESPYNLGFILLSFSHFSPRQPKPNDTDKTAGNIIITTDHLSVYGAFVIGKEYTRAAYVDFTLPKVAIRNASSSADYAGIISEAIDNNMSPGPSALELGNKVVGDWLNMSGAGLTFLTNTVYATEFLNGIGSAMSNVGLFSAIAQAAVDYQKGDSVALHSNLIKNLSYYAVSKFGSAILQLGSVGVYCIDYALNEFAAEAWSGREDIYTEAYRLYYLRESGVKRTPKDWYYILMPMARAAKSPEELNQKIMEEVDRYCWQFWEDELTVAVYQDQAQKNGFTGGGGLNQDMKDKISGRQKNDLLNYSLEPVFMQIGRMLSREHEEQVRKELDTIARELNKLVEVQVFDSNYDEADPKPEKAQYAGYIARIAPLDDKVTDKEKWQQEIDDEGKASLYFRVLGHIMAGSPGKVQIVNPEDDEVIKEFDFVVSPPTVRVDIADKSRFSRLIFATGTGSNIITGVGIISALQEADSISMRDDGSFSVTVPFVETSAKSAGSPWHITTSNLTLQGKWNKEEKTGSATISGVVHTTRIDKDYLEDDYYDEIYFRTTYDYDDSVTGEADITMEGEQIVMSFKISYYRNGYTELVRVAVKDGETNVGDNPTITDKTGPSSVYSWVYRFNIN